MKKARPGRAFSLGLPLHIVSVTTITVAEAVRVLYSSDWMQGNDQHAKSPKNMQLAPTQTPVPFPA